MAKATGNAAQCPKSPTGAHHRICNYVDVGGLDHQHLAQDCKYCDHRLMTPCWRCRDREEEKKAAATKRPIRLVKKAS